jgi:hypothetical protein
MKPKPKYSPLFAVHSGLILLLFAFGLAVSSGDQATLRLTTLRVTGLLLGAWIPGQLFATRYVTVWAWKVKGHVAVTLAGLGGLLCVVSVYALARSVWH